MKIFAIVAIATFSFSCAHHTCYNGCSKKNSNHHFEKTDTNKDGKISKEESQAYSANSFNEQDGDNNGFVTIFEMKAWKKNKKKSYHDQSCSSGK